MSENNKILVSACLMGEAVRYDGGHADPKSEALARLRNQGRLVSFCPECAAGLPVPRPAAERLGDRVVDDQGDDLTDAFERGAQLALKLCQTQGISLAILKENSPSCGSKFIYDGSFSGTKIPGQGLTARLLQTNGIRVISEDELADGTWIGA